MTENKDWCVVIPTIRKHSFDTFMEAWIDLFRQHKVKVIVIEDNPTKTFDMPKHGLDIDHYSWQEIDEHVMIDDGKNVDFTWIFPRRCDGIRSFGFYKAYKAGYKYVLTLDDDVVPCNYSYDIFEEYERVFKAKVANSNYYNVGDMHVTPTYHMRGFPFSQRAKNVDVWIQYGGWCNVPDFDAITQLEAKQKDGYTFTKETYVVPRGMALTGCIMNCAMRREAIPYMYQLLMGINHNTNKPWGFERWGDIWSGLYAKYHMDILNKGVAINGLAQVCHTRASDTMTNLQKEASGYGANEDMWDNLHKYRGMIKTTNDEYDKKLYEAIKLWKKLTKDY